MEEGERNRGGRTRGRKGESGKKGGREAEREGLEREEGVKVGW